MIDNIASLIIVITIFILATIYGIRELKWANQVKKKVKELDKKAGNKND